VAPEHIYELLIVDLMPCERIPNDTCEVATVDMCGREVVHRSNHRCDRKPVYHRPLVRSDVAAMDANVGSPRLLTLFGSELELIRLEIPEFMNRSGRSVRHHGRHLVAKACSGPASRVKSKPCRTEVIERRGRSPGDTVDAVGHALEGALLGEPCYSLRRYTKGTGLRSGHKTPLLGRKIGQI
jgi:hypothetical protein